MRLIRAGLRLGFGISIRNWVKARIKMEIGFWVCGGI